MHDVIRAKSSVVVKETENCENSWYSRFITTELHAINTVTSPRSKGAPRNLLCVNKTFGDLATRKKFPEN